MLSNESKTGNKMQDAIEMEGVVVSVLGNYKSDTRRDRSKRNPVSIQMNRRGNESEEELTKEGKGITVYTTVEIQTHDTVTGIIEADSVGSIRSDA